MNNRRKMPLGSGLASALWVISLLLAANITAAAQGYLPDGPNVPTITLNESEEGAAGLPPLPVPPPNGWNQESIWNMKVVGFNDNQGRPSSDDGWIENENGRYILYMTDSGGSAYNPHTRCSSTTFPRRPAAPRMSRCAPAACCRTEPPGTGTCSGMTGRSTRRSGT